MNKSTALGAQYCNVIHVTTPLTACTQSTLSIQISNQIREKALFLMEKLEQDKACCQKQNHRSEHRHSLRANCKLPKGPTNTCL